MNLFAVTAILNGRAKTMWVKCKDEVDAYERANAELMFGGKIVEVRWIRRES